MIREKENRTPVIDLTGPDGNAFSLLARAERWGRDLGFDTEEIIEEMESGDYENLVSVFDRFFGDYVILER